MINTRNGFLLIWLSSALMIVIALYMQYFMDLAPCALCITQRVFVIAVGVVALLAWLHLILAKPGTISIRVYCAAGMLMAIIGGAFSLRHLWLQSLPIELAPACGPSLSYLLETVPFLEALEVLLKGDGNCAETSWSLFGITIPGWTLIAFIGLFIINAIIFYKAKWQNNSIV